MFLTKLTAEHCSQIDASEFVCLDFETTGLTQSSRPVAVGGTAKIGPTLTFKAYKELHDATLNCRVRARILTVSLENGLIFSWDLDAMSADEQRTLLHTCIQDKTLVGHNLTFDLTWARSICGEHLTPGMVLDTLLLTRCIRPSMTWQTHTNAALGNLDCMAVIQAGKGNASASLASLTAGHGIGKLDKSYQHPRNWCVLPLSQGHFDYVVGDVTAPVALMKIIAGVSRNATFQQTLNQLVFLDKTYFGGTYFGTYRYVPCLLSRMSQRGLPLHVPTLDRIEMHRMSLIPALVSEVVSLIPEMEVHMVRLLSSQAGVPEELKWVLYRYAAFHGVDIGIGKDGKPVVASKNSRITKASKLEGWKAWNALQGAKKVIGLCSEYRGISCKSDIMDFKKLHPLLGANAVTMRVTSECPNVQNLVRNAKDLDDKYQFRSAIRAHDGYSIVSADYGQVELRIGAALALRTISAAHYAIQDRTGVPGWILEALDMGKDPMCKLDLEAPGFDGIRNGFAMAWRNAMAGSAMADALRAGVDPHLLTALTLAVMQGVKNLGGMPALDYLKALSKEDSKALAKELSTQRNSAKALNFGLLYGMSANGLWALGVSDYFLDWSIADAVAARDEWFKLFPEFLFWQQWDKYVNRAPSRDAIKMIVRDRYTLEVKEAKIQLGGSYTLSGRPVCAEIQRDLSNYSDQGTAADVMLDACVSLPPVFQSFLMNTVHDEIFMHVPDDQVPAACEALKKAMIDAEDKVLAPWGIPSDADPSVTKYWKKVD